MAAPKEIYNFLLLTDDLLTSGQPTREQFSLIAAAGVKTVINLALHTGSSALPDERTIVKSLGMNYVHIPVIWESPTKANLEKFFSTMEAQSGKKVFIHCAANMRVSAFVALYRILRLGCDRDNAFKSTYRIWDPFKDEVWGKFIELALAK